MHASRSERRVLPRATRKVIHRHRLGQRDFRRVSELVFVRGKPYAVLEWIDLSGDRAPLYLPLDPRKLRASRVRNTFYYDGTTSDPRFEDVEPRAGG
jgi:hypothetical protein